MSDATLAPVPPTLARAPRNPAAVALGRLGGLKRSQAKAKAAQANLTAARAKLAASRQTSTP